MGDQTLMLINPLNYNQDSMDL